MEKLSRILHDLDQGNINIELAKQQVLDLFAVINSFIMRKTIDELRKLNTKNLLRFYKAERRRFYGSGYWCGCGCGEMIWEARTSQADMEQKYNEHKDFLCLIKTELNTREHVS